MIGSVLKAIDILELFTTAEPDLALAQISRKLGLPKTTTFNLLATLVSRGYLVRVDGDRYALGSTVIALTQSVWINVELRDRAAPLLREMADRSRESVYLTAREATQCLYIYAVESPRRLLARTAVGDRMPLHCTAVGKAMLAFLPQDAVDTVVENVGLPPVTPTTITDQSVLRAELEATRVRGYSLDHGENEVGVFCMGAPILDARGQVIGACSISGPDPEIVDTRVPDLAPLLLHTAQEISRRLGYVPDKPNRIATFDGAVSLVSAD